MVFENIPQHLDLQDFNAQSDQGGSVEMYFMILIKSYVGTCMQEHRFKV